jgi:hypothetical protein
MKRVDRRDAERDGEDALGDIQNLFADEGVAESEAYTAYVDEKKAWATRIPDPTRDLIIVAVAEVERTAYLGEENPDRRCDFAITVQRPDDTLEHHVVPWQHRGGSAELVGTIWPPWEGIYAPGGAYTELLTPEEYKEYEAEAKRTEERFQSHQAAAVL